MASDRECRRIGSRVARAFRLPTVIVLLIVVAGCGGGDGLARVEVQGAVTFDGAPVKAGRVNFIPEGKTRGPASGANIDAGRFLISRERGPVPGNYLVRVRITDPDTSPKVAEPRPRTKEEILAGENDLVIEDSRSSNSSSRSSRDAAKDTSPEFHVTVTAEGPNSFDLPVGKDGSAAKPAAR